MRPGRGPQHRGERACLGGRQGRATADDDELPVTVDQPRHDGRQGRSGALRALRGLGARGPSALAPSPDVDTSDWVTAALSAGALAVSVIALAVSLHDRRLRERIAGHVTVEPVYKNLAGALRLREAYVTVQNDSRRPVQLVHAAIHEGGIGVDIGDLLGLPGDLSAESSQTFTVPLSRMPPFDEASDMPHQLAVLVRGIHKGRSVRWDSAPFPTVEPLD